MSGSPVVAILQRVTEEFGSQTAVSFAGEALVGACAGDGESYVMRWPALPGPYEPLIVLAGRVVEVGASPDGARLVVAASHGDAASGGPLSLTMLDLAGSRRADLVNPGDGLVLTAARPTLTWSPDGRFAAVAGAQAEGREGQLTLVFEVGSDTPHRWMLSGYGTRWHEGRLLLLEAHGVSAWAHDLGTEFLGDAPPRVSPDGAWEVVVVEDGLEVRGPDAVERRVALDGEHRELVAWLRPGHAILGLADPLVLELSTLGTRPLVAPGHVFRAVSPDGGRVVVQDDEWLYWGSPTRE